MPQEKINVKARITLTGVECRNAFRRLSQEPNTEDILPADFNAKQAKNIVQVLRGLDFTVEANRFQKTVIITDYRGSDPIKAQAFIYWLAENVKSVGFIVWETADYTISQVLTREDVITFSFDVTERKEKLSIPQLELKTSGAQSHAARDRFLETITALKREGKKITWSVTRSEPADVYTNVEGELDLVSMTRLRDSINPAKR